MRMGRGQIFATSPLDARRPRDQISGNQCVQDLSAGRPRPPIISQKRRPNDTSQGGPAQIHMGSGGANGALTRLKVDGPSEHAQHYGGWRAQNGADEPSAKTVVLDQTRLCDVREDGLGPGMFC